MPNESDSLFLALIVSLAQAHAGTLTISTRLVRLESQMNVSFAGVYGMPQKRRDWNAKPGGYCMHQWRVPCTAVVPLRAGEGDPCHATTRGAGQSSVSRMGTMRAAARLEEPHLSPFPVNRALEPVSSHGSRFSSGSFLSFRLAMIRPDAAEWPQWTPPQVVRYARLVRKLATKLSAALDDPEQKAPATSERGAVSSIFMSPSSGLLACNMTGAAWGTLLQQADSKTQTWLPELQHLVEHFFEPYASRVAFNGAPVAIRRVVVGRNVRPAAGVSILTRASLWHYDALPETTVKLLVYLTPVDASDGCMMVMLDKDMLPFRMNPAHKPWGRHIFPFVVRPWVTELLERGYAPHCITGGVGTLTFFQTNIVHRASVPAEGRVRDFLLLEFSLDAGRAGPRWPDISERFDQGIPEKQEGGTTKVTERRALSAEGKATFGALKTLRTLQLPVQRAASST